MEHSRERYQFVLALKRGLEIIDSPCLTDEEASAVVNTIDVACKVLKVSLRISEIESILPEVEEGSLTMEMLNESLRVNKLLVMAYSAELTTAMEKKQTMAFWEEHRKMIVNVIQAGHRFTAEIETSYAEEFTIYVCHSWTVYDQRTGESEMEYETICYDCRSESEAFSACMSELSKLVSKYIY